MQTQDSENLQNKFDIKQDEIENLWDSNQEKLQKCKSSQKELSSLFEQLQRLSEQQILEENKDQTIMENKFNKPKVKKNFQIQNSNSYTRNKRTQFLIQEQQQRNQTNNLIENHNDNINQEQFDQQEDNETPNQDDSHQYSQDYSGYNNNKQKKEMLSDVYHQKRSRSKNTDNKQPRDYNKMEIIREKSRLKFKKKTMQDALQKNKFRQNKNTDYQNFINNSDLTKNKQKKKKEEELRKNYNDIKDLYVKQNFDIMNQYIANYSKDFDLDFIDFNKKNKNQNTLFEECILSQKYDNIRKYCYDKVKSKYNAKHIIQYVNDDCLEGVYCSIQQTHEKDKMYKIDSKNEMTVLMYASCIGNIRIMKLLIENFKVDIEKKDKNGWTCYFFACYCQQKDAIKYLKEQGVDTKLKDKKGRTGFYYFKPSKNKIEKLMKYINYNQFLLINIKRFKNNKMQQKHQILSYLSYNFCKQKVKLNLDANLKYIEVQVIPKMSKFKIQKLSKTIVNYFVKNNYTQYFIKVFLNYIILKHIYQFLSYFQGARQYETQNEISISFVTNINLNLFDKAQRINYNFALEKYKFQKAQSQNSFKIHQLQRQKLSLNCWLYFQNCDLSIVFIIIINLKIQVLQKFYQPFYLILNRNFNLN